ncbi:MAG: sigma-70 family RNA polymerase sigma factor [Acidobacteriota bacterium]
MSTGTSLSEKTTRRGRGRTGTEKDILFRLKNQDQGALRAVIDKYHEKLFAVANRICKNPADSEEVLQDVYMTAISKIDRFEERSSLSTWLYRITVNAALMKLRSQRYTKLTIPMENLTTVLRDEESTMAAEDQVRSPAETLMAKELQEKVKNSVDTLPEIYRTVFVLRDLRGLSIRETSELLQTTPAAIKSRLHRSRFFLREKLREYYEFN